MIEIYTTYFSKLKNIPEDITPISISLYQPFPITSYNKLAPPESLLKEMKEGKLTITEYTERYVSEVLDKLSPGEVIKDLYDLSGFSEKIALVCYEKPPTFCHRHIVGAWLGDKWYKGEC